METEALAAPDRVSEIERIPGDMLQHLRSDHAGETGAVCIYRGILALSRDQQVRAFARRHLASEERHLDIMNRLLPARHRSRLLPVWRAAGWLTGALPALCGPAAVYRTIEAVETFVDRHYAAQIYRLESRPRDRALRELLQSCRADEVQHRDEARTLLQPPGLAGRLWTRAVAAGSSAGVWLASRI